MANIIDNNKMKVAFPIGTLNSIHQLIKEIEGNYFQKLKNIYRKNGI